MPSFCKRFQKAVAYAVWLHANQLRKATEIPYVAHLFGVAGLAMEYGATEDKPLPLSSTTPLKTKAESRRSKKSAADSATTLPPSFTVAPTPISSPIRRGVKGKSSTSTTSAMPARRSVWYRPATSCTTPVASSATFASRAIPHSESSPAERTAPSGTTARWSMHLSERFHIASPTNSNVWSPTLNVCRPAIRRRQPGND